MRCVAGSALASQADGGAGRRGIGERRHELIVAIGTVGHSDQKLAARPLHHLHTMQHGVGRNEPHAGVAETAVPFHSKRAGNGSVAWMEHDGIVAQDRTDIERAVAGIGHHPRARRR